MCSKHIVWTKFHILTVMCRWIFKDTVVCSESQPLSRVTHNIHMMSHSISDSLQNVDNLHFNDKNIWKYCSHIWCCVQPLSFPLSSLKYFTWNKVNYNSWIVTRLNVTLLSNLKHLYLLFNADTWNFIPYPLFLFIVLISQNYYTFPRIFYYASTSPPALAGDKN
jgi:hypothetical protein